MADFVAVIRRAVDGLANNTPEMRLRVYDKARGAVQRQLENMKPRPSDDMLRRQMDKLETAITSVEAEHAEAFPAFEPEVVPAFAADMAEPPPYEPEPEAPHALSVQDDAASSYGGSAYEYVEPAETVHADEADTSRDVSGHDMPTHDQPVERDEPDAGGYDVAAEQTAAEQTYVYPEAVEEDHRDRDYGSDEPHAVPQWDEPAPAAVAYTDEPVFGRDAGGSLEAEPRAAETDIPAPMSESAYPDLPTWPEDPDAPHLRPAAEDHGFIFGTSDADAAPAEPPKANDLLDAHSPASIEPEPWTWREDTHAAPATVPETVAPAWTDPVELPRYDEPRPAEPVAGGQFDDRHAVDSFDAHFEPPVAVAATARMPAAADLPDFDKAPARHPANHDDAFGEFLSPQTVAASAAVGTVAARPADADPWNDLEELIGYNKAAADAAASAPTSHDDDLNDDMMPPPVRPYRVAPKPKRSFGPIILAVLGLVIVGGGGYVAWANWDAVDELISGVVGSNTDAGTAQPSPSSSSSGAAATTPPATPPATSQANTPAQTPANGQAANTAAPADGAVAGQKFTQRLMANGTEVDEGAGGPPASGGGQSVAQLNSPPGSPATTPPTENAQAPASGVTPPPATPAVNPADTAAVTGEKMFLYEERLGQPAPTAVEGTVSWSLQREAGENGRSEPAVQARINIPGRGLTALVTFKRNSDASLPASHLIELVFSVPPDFEGGAVDSVQRIAMKDTEQDRGTPLVAVPAKITDDFHMIALNDFPDARATNLELLRSKNWLDIPLAYRNGRRALLTLQKGPEGIKAFDTAIREWSTLSPATGQ